MHDALEIKREGGLDHLDGTYPPRQIPEFKRGVGRKAALLEGGLWGIWWPFTDRLKDRATLRAWLPELTRECLLTIRIICR